MGFLVLGFLIFAAFAAVLAYQRYCTREVLHQQKRFSAQMDAEFTGWFRVLEGAVTDFRKESDERNTDWQKEMKALFDQMSVLEAGLAEVAARGTAEDAARKRLALLAAGLEELRKTAPAQTAELCRLREDVGKLSHELGLLAAAGAPYDRDSQLSKAMEEGVMNLMQYAAGKTSGGVEVSLG